MPDSSYDVIVVGAGLSGLAAGIRLAQYDQKVVLLERHYLWGGLNSYYKKDGHRFDTGLHALTNFARRGERGRPLTRVLRQLRLPWQELELQEQRESRTVFPEVSLRFNNDFELLRSEVHAAFPEEREGFDRLAAELAAAGYADVTEARPARQVLAGYLSDPLLIDLLLHPILWYGSPTPGDVQWPVFVVMWKSLYEEGFARPAGGMRPLLDRLRRRYLELGGELRMRAGVAQIVRAGGAVQGVRLEDGTELSAPRVLSSAGFVETMAMCGAPEHESEAGRMSFVETCSVLDAQPAELDWDATITFYNLAPRTVYGVPETDVDVRSGVLCCPSNYIGNEADAPHFRVTVLANPDLWKAKEDEDYYARKSEVLTEALDAVASFGADVRGHVIYQDAFTPRTIEHYTGHRNGAVYGAPRKRWDGRTDVGGLFLIGTDQGNYGIVGAMMSGIDGANRHALAQQARTTTR